MSDQEAATIPASVERLVGEAEVAAEYTIGWVRIAVGLALLAGGSFIWLELAARSGGALFHRASFIALVAVGAFVVLGFVSLLLVLRQWYRPWMAFALVTGDAAILVLAVFSGLEENALGGNWIAAMPVLWAAPLVLSVGALRYRPAVQLWVTTLLMIGLVGVALVLGFRPFLVDPDAAAISPVVPGKIERLFSLPPYLMRSGMLVLIGLTTALVMIRARRLLVRAISETSRRESLARFLPAEIAPLVGTHTVASLLRGRRQQATLLFVDIRGSTAFAERMDPAQLSVFVSAFRRRVMRAAEAHGGVIDKFVGDGALLVFGIPEPRPDDPARAIASARKLLALVGRWNAKRQFDPPVSIGIGIHSGEVYCGVIGDERRLEFTVLGDTVNVAARIEQATKQFDTPLLASENVVTAAGERAGWREVTREPMRGRSEPVIVLAPSQASLSSRTA